MAFNRNIAKPLHDSQDYNLENPNVRCEQCMKLTGTMIVTQGDFPFKNSIFQCIPISKSSRQFQLFF